MRVRDRLRELVTQRAFTRIGKSLRNGGLIPAEKIAETAEVVRTQAAVASEVGAEQIVAVATAAIRTRRQPRRSWWTPCRRPAGWS